MNGESYYDNDVFRPEPCKMCTCEKGEIICEEIFCEDLLDCEDPVIPEGECCPICNGTSTLLI